MKKYYFYFLVLLFNISFTNELNSSSIKKWRQPFTHNDEIIGINPYHGREDAPEGELKILQGILQDKE